MQNEEVESGNKGKDNPKVKSLCKLKSWLSNKPVDESKSIVRNVSFIATAAVAFLASSYMWQNQFLPSSADASAIEDAMLPIAEITQPLPSLVPTIPEKGPFLVSQLPDINYQLVSQPSQIPVWLAGAVRQQVQPSPKRVVDVALDDESDDSLVVRDRVVVIPKELHPQVARTPAVKKTSSQTISPPIKPTKTVNKQFTIQVLASHKQENIMRFVSSHKLKKGVKIRLTKSGGLDWYVLTIGEFSEVEQAQKVVKNLPVELVKLNPWIRSVEQLRALG